MHVEGLDEKTEQLLIRYRERLSLPADRLWVTGERRTFQRWIGRRVSAAYGGAYTVLPGRNTHVILINLDRIDRNVSQAVEVVVAEELLHMRDWLDGDRRRHAHHGYDRIAHRVATLTGASLEDIRAALLPRKRRPFRYVYGCPRCRRRLPRRRRGVWSCGSCAP